MVWNTVSLNDTSTKEHERQARNFTVIQKNIVDIRTTEENHLINIQNI